MDYKEIVLNRRLGEIIRCHYNLRQLRQPSIAARGREVLMRFGIGINDAINGVLLPIEQSVSDAIYHCTMHTAEYYETVNELLESCETREQVIETLQYIAECLLNGELP